MLQSGVAGAGGAVLTVQSRRPTALANGKQWPATPQATPTRRRHRLPRDVLCIPGHAFAVAMRVVCESAADAACVLSRSRPPSPVVVSVAAHTPFARRRPRKLEKPQASSVKRQASGVERQASSVERRASSLMPHASSVERRPGHPWQNPHLITHHSSLTSAVGAHRPRLHRFAPIDRPSRCGVSMKAASGACSCARQSPSLAFYARLRRPFPHLARLTAALIHGLDRSSLPACAYARPDLDCHSCIFAMTSVRNGTTPQARFRSRRASSPIRRSLSARAMYAATQYTVDYYVCVL